jgi:glutaredoxin 3
MNHDGARWMARGSPRRGRKRREIVGSVRWLGMGIPWHARTSGGAQIIDSTGLSYGMSDLKLYVKVWCPWCVMAQEWLDERGYKYEVIDVELSRAAYDEMIELSGQPLTPTILVDDEKVLPDFGPEELERFFQKHQIEP